MKFSFRDIFKVKWSYRRYKLWVINTTTPCNLYLWDNWKLLLPSIDELIKLTTEPAFIRTFQSFPFENKWLGFGRMKWNEENNIKWTTKYRSADVNKSPTFYGTEIWAPDWNKVNDTSMPPDVFVSLYNYADIEAIREGLMIAIPQALYKNNQLLVDKLLLTIGAHIPDSKMVEIERGWRGKIAVGNSIEATNPHELMKMVAAG